MYRERQFLRLCRRTRIMGRQHQQKETVGENQHWQEEIVVHWERLFRNIRTTAAQVRAELNVHLEDPASTKTVWRELHKSSIHGRATAAKPLIVESNAQMHKRWRHNHKSWTSDKCKRARYGQMSRPSRCSLHQEEFTFGEHPRKPTIRNAWFGSTVKHGEVLWWFRQQYRATVFCWSHC
jgi:hypothetical protein